MDIQSNAGLLWGRNRPMYRNDAVSGCDVIGLKAAGILRQPSTGWALKRSISDMYGRLPSVAGSTSFSVRPLSEEGSYELISVRRGAVQNAEDYRFSAKAVGDTSVLLGCASDINAHQLDADLCVAFQQRLLQLSSSQVLSLIERLVKFLGGVPLGGINTFYIPPQSVARLDEFRLASGLKGYSMTSFGISTDIETVGAVLSALKAEISVAVMAIEEKVARGGLDRRGAKAIQKQADALKSKAEAYASTFGVNLDALVGSIESAANSSAVSALLAASI